MKRSSICWCPPGLMHAYGRGVNQDFPTAAALFVKCADSNFAAALYYLGVFASQGLGTQVDYLAASLWFEKAAKFAEPQSDVFERAHTARQELAVALKLAREENARLLDRFEDSSLREQLLAELADFAWQDGTDALATEFRVAKSLDGAAGELQGSGIRSHVLSGSYKFSMNATPNLYESFHVFTFAASCTWNLQCGKEYRKRGKASEVQDALQKCKRLLRSSPGAYASKLKRRYKPVPAVSSHVHLFGLELHHRLYAPSLVDARRNRALLEAELTSHPPVRLQDVSESASSRS
eukprot:scaffold7028_cov243-Pinguiococcus_pyrenoidosus.AAC.18